MAKTSSALKPALFVPASVAIRAARRCYGQHSHELCCQCVDTDATGSTGRVGVPTTKPPAGMGRLDAKPIPAMASVLDGKTFGEVGMHSVGVLGSGVLYVKSR